MRKNGEKNMIGTVKWFNDQRGYGFITPDNGDGDLFVHHSAIQGMSGRVTLTEGQKVEFEIGESEKGPCAVDVRLLG